PHTLGNCTLVSVCTASCDFGKRSYERFLLMRERNTDSLPTAMAVTIGRRVRMAGYLMYGDMSRSSGKATCVSILCECFKLRPVQQVTQAGGWPDQPCSKRLRCRQMTLGSSFIDSCLTDSCNSLQ